MARLVEELQSARPGAAFVDVFVGGVIIQPGWRHLVRVKPGQDVHIVRAVKGDLFSKLAIIALTVAATALAGPIGTAIAGYVGAGAFGTALITAGVTAGLSVAASLAANAFFPPSQVGRRDLLENSKSNSITGTQNQPRLGGVIPDIIGEHRMFFDMAHLPFTTTRGGDQYAHLLFMCGHGHVDVSDIKIGETPIENFDDVEVEIVQNQINPRPSTFGRVVSEPQIGVTLDRDVQHVRTSAIEARRLDIEIAIPAGSYRLTKKGNERNWPLKVLFEYRAVGDTAWLPAPVGNTDVPGEKRFAIAVKGFSRRSVRWVVPEGQYEVRVTKTTSGADDLTPEEEDEYEDDQIISEVKWVTLRTFEAARPINFSKPVTVIGMSIRASDQLSGQLDRVNGIASKRGRRFDGAAWIDGVPRNTAEAYMTALKSAAHDQPINDDQIDFPSIELLWAKANAEGWRYNQIHDFATTPFKAFNQILASGRARVDLTTGKWGAFFDEGEAAPVVHRFNGANIGPLRSLRSDAEIPHAFRVRFRNAENGWNFDEVVVYRAGYSAANATFFAPMEYQGLKYASDNYDRAQYDFDQVQLQSWSRTFPVNRQMHLYRRGERGLLCHPSLGGPGGGWVRAIEGNQIVLSAPVTLGEDGPFDIEFHHVETGDTSATRVLNAAGTWKVLEVDGVPAATEVGDLYSIGPAGAIGQEVVISDIAPNKDGGAIITVHAANLDFVSQDPNSPPDFVTSIPEGLPAHEAAPVNLEFRQYLAPTDNGVENNVELTFEAAGLLPTAAYAGRWRLVDGSDADWERIAIAGVPRVLLVNVPDGQYQAQFRTLAAGSSEYSRWSEVLDFEVNGRGAPPLPLIAAGADLLDDNALQLTAIAPVDVNRASFIVRHTPRIIDATLLDAETVVEGASSFPVRLKPQGGTYYFNTVSHAGVESITSKIVVVDPDLIKSFDVAETLQFGPSWSGGLTRVKIDNDFLSLDHVNPADTTSAYEADGAFFAAGVIDLGAVFRAELTAEIDSFGLSKEDDVFLRESWFVPEFFDAVSATEYSTKAEYRYTNDDPSGSPAWSDWLPLQAKVERFRAVAFRLVLKSFRGDVTPIVRSVTFGVDPVEREVEGRDVAAPSGGLRVDYSGPFYRVLAGPLIIAQDGNGGDRAPEITNSDETGFDIRFYNGVGVAVARTFDYRTKGLGGN